MHVRLLLRGIRAARRERNLHVVPRLFRSFLDGRAAAQNDQVSEGHLRPFVPVGPRTVELLLNRLQLRQDLRQFGRLVHFPILLRSKANARAVRPSALVGAAERRRRCPGSCDQLGERQSRCEDLGLKSSNVLIPDQFMIHGGNRVLPHQFFLRNERAEVPRDRPHVAVRQLEPCPRKRVCELVRMLVEAP